LAQPATGRREMHSTRDSLNQKSTTSNHKGRLAMMNSPLRIFSLWVILVLGVALAAEMGCVTGVISRGVLDQLADQSASWWQEARWLHGVQSLLLVVLLVWTWVLLFSPGGARHTKLVGGLAAVLLSSHFSPLHAGLAYAPVVGTLLSLVLVTWLLRRTGSRPDPRVLFQAIRKARPADAILWSLAVVIVIYTVVNQFGEAARVVSRDTDFGAFYDAAVATTRGSDPYAATRGAYFYPPTFAFYFAVLTGLPKAGASLLWFAIKLALVIWTLVSVYDLVKERCSFASSRRWLAVGVVLVAARFLLADLQYGNVNAFILWLSIVAIVLDFEERPVLAGLAAAAAVSVKIVPAVFLLYFVFRGRYRVALWLGVWLLALNLGPLISAPHEFAKTWTSYFDTGVYGKLASRLAQPDNQSLWGALNRSIDLPLSHVRVIWMACSVVLTAVAAWVTRRVRGEGRFRESGAAALFFLLGVLVSPGSWVVHYGAVLLPMSYLLAAGVMCASRSRAYWIVFIAANLAFTISGWWRSTVRLSIEQSWFVAANCLLFITLVFLVLVTRSNNGGSRALPDESAA